MRIRATCKAGPMPESSVAKDAIRKVRTSKGTLKLIIARYGDEPWGGGFGRDNPRHRGIAF